MTEIQDGAPAQAHPPYIAWRTITDLIERMVQEEPPARIDKSYLDSYSGGYQTQVIAALNVLGMREEDGSVTDLLQALVEADEELRKKMVGELVRSIYGSVLALGINATQQQMLDAFKALGVNPGDTMRKVIAFFLNAAKFSGITVSRHWRVPRVPPSTRAKKATPVGTEEPDENLGAKPHEPQAGSTGKPNVRIIELRSGGTVSVTVSVDLFSLSTDDEKFVMGLIKSMRLYEDQRMLPPGPSNSAAITEPADADDLDQETF
ncbi:MAG TPA: DUF5343 domain-containing protein [Acidimicrobiales bacterium]|nr:DUF5343 domain-containing protein [Acidimicrobiales bacterium]